MFENVTTQYKNFQIDSDKTKTIKSELKTRNISNYKIKLECGEGFDFQHAMSCKKGGFVTLRHNEVRDITGTLLSDVCKDVELELSFFIKEQAMRNKVLDEAQRYICDRIFWVCG